MRSDGGGSTVSQCWGFRPRGGTTRSGSTRTSGLWRTRRLGMRLGRGVVDAGLLTSLAPSSGDWIQLVFVDGHYSPEHSTSGVAENGVVVGRLGDVAGLSSNGVGERLGSLADVESDGFTALNTAFTTDGAVVKIAAGNSAPPVHLVFVTTERGDAIATHPRALVVAGEGSECTVVESYVGVGESTYFTNSVSEIILEAGAQVEHYRLMMDSPGAFHIGSTPVRLGEDSTFNSLSFARGGAGRAERAARDARRAGKFLHRGRTVFYLRDATYRQSHRDRSPQSRTRQ